ESTRAALATLAGWPEATRRIAVLGDMLELGGDAPRLHRETGEAARDAEVWAVGTYAGEWAAGATRAGVEARRFADQAALAEGLQAHLAKEGTPTMGGLLIVTAIVLPTLLWGNFHSRPVWIALFATVWLGALGFLDDYLRVVKGLRRGLLGRYKLAGQIAL